MLEHTKRQVHKWKILQHALSRYVYNRSLFDIFIQVERRSLEKNQDFNGIRTRDLRDTGAMLYQLSYEATHRPFS